MGALGFMPFSLWVLLVLFSTAHASSYLRVCYYTNWAQYRHGRGHFTPTNITDPGLCTHIIYAFMNLARGRLITREWNDKVRLAEINALKKNSRELKTMVAVGGWNAEHYDFSKMAESFEKRKRFINSAIKLIREHQFDGLDLGWKHPNKHLSNAADKQNFALLVKELKTAFNLEAVNSRRPRLLLSAAVAAGKKQIDMSYDVEEISKHLDFINLMAYDFHGSWQNKTGENAPLYARPGETSYEKTLNVDFAANYWVSLGAPRRKLVIGMAAYGRSFTLASSTRYGVGAWTKGPGLPGQYTNEPGVIAYYEACIKEGSSGSRFLWDIPQKVPFLVQDTLWVGYDNKRSIREKMHWLLGQRFGGAMLWVLDLEDFGGICRSSDNRKFPLLQIIRDHLVSAEENSALQPDLEISP